MMITAEQQLGRAKNEVLHLLQKRLVVPRIYLDAKWDGTSIDVLAIDRDGVGDVHAVLLLPATFFADGKQDIVREAHAILDLLDHFRNVHAQYKYIAIVNTHADPTVFRFGLSQDVRERTFSEDGLGRVGFIVVETPDDKETGAQVAIKPERFRAFVGQKADQFVLTNQADWELRPDPIIEESHV